MNVNKNYIFQIITALILTGCAGQQQNDSIKESLLTRSPIGVYTQDVYSLSSGKTDEINLTVRNNTGRFIRSLYIEVFFYDNDKRVGNTNEIFNSVNPGETMEVLYKPVLSHGRPWNKTTFTYEIH